MALEPAVEVSLQLQTARDALRALWVASQTAQNATYEEWRALAVRSHELDETGRLELEMVWRELQRLTYHSEGVRQALDLIWPMWPLTAD